MGCDANQTNGERYLERLAAVLDVEVEAAEIRALPGFPAASSLRIERATRKINWLEYLEVNRCDLGALVGARNSGLGRTQTPSQRWLYESQLVAGLLACEGATPKLRSVATQRRGELGIAAFNVLFAGPEWHAFATPPLVVATQGGADINEDDRMSTAMGFDAPSVARAALALKSLFAQSGTTGSSNAELSSLEDHLARLRFSAALGIQRQAWAKQSDILERATRMLLSALATNPACRTGQPTERGRIRRNIFEQFYVTGVQPELTAQGQPDRGWLKAVAELVEATATRATIDDERDLLAQAQRVKNWHEQVLGLHPRSEFGRWRAAITAHSRVWQRQLSLCGLMPKPNTRPSA